MPFDFELLVSTSLQKIETFAAEHRDETFYAFAIDANLLCLNSEEQLAKIVTGYQQAWDHRCRPIAHLSDMTDTDRQWDDFGLDRALSAEGRDRSDTETVLRVINDRRARRRERGNRYRTEEGMASLRKNTGDWAYQGFGELEDSDGFDWTAYEEHYYEAMGADGLQAPHTDYGRAMTELCVRLNQADAFRNLERTSDFTARWVEHTY